MSISRQCDILGLARSSFYYAPVPVSEEDLMLMRAIESLHWDYPFFGYRRICSHLANVIDAKYLPVNDKKIRRLMRLMDLKTIYPKENLSKRNLAHKIFPYLLRNVELTHIRQIYSTDITYIPMKKGFLYLTAVIDWYSRMILSWRLSNTLSVDFCLEVVEEAFEKYGKPDIFNTDQGSQYTSNLFIDLLQKNEVKISMDGKGRATDNIYIERFWRTIKTEHIYLYDYESVKELYKGVSQFIEFYNSIRKHQSLNNATPKQIFFN